MTDLIIVVILLLMIGTAVIYIVKARKSGVKCIGCPAGSTCSHKCNGDGSCGCGGDREGSCHE